MYDEVAQEFIDTKETILQLEHSLLSISKWESKWKKPFLGKDPKTFEEEIDYVRCMTINKNVDPNSYLAIRRPQLNEVWAYIEDTHTATWFSKNLDKSNTPQSSRAITSELIYSWMVAFNIPFECEKWHLNRLLTLIRIVETDNAPKKKMGRREGANWQKAENARRRARLGTRG